MRLLQHAKDERDTDIVLQKVKEDYKDIDERLLENDLIELFHLLNVYNIITWDKNDLRYSSLYESGSESTLYRLAGDDDYQYISDYIIEIGLKSRIHYSQVVSAQYYSPFALRYRTFNNQEYYVYTCRSNKIIACAGFIPPAFGSIVLTVSTFFFSDELSKEEIFECFTGMVKRLKPKLFGKVYKVRISSNSSNNEKIKDIATIIGLKEECILRDETEYGDLIMYTKNI